MRKLIGLAALPLLVVTAPVSAGPSMEDMMAQFQNCYVCGDSFETMVALMPVMQHDIVELNDGVAMMCSVTDAAQVEKYHAACDAMYARGAESAKFTTEEAKTKLCPMCQNIHGLVASGAVMSMGKSSDGSLMVITSEDAAVQAQIADFRKANVEMMKMMDVPPMGTETSGG